MRTDNPDLDFARFDHQRERELNRCPVCSECGHHIQEEYIFEVGSETFCEQCMFDLFRKPNNFYE